MEAVWLQENEVKGQQSTCFKLFGRISQPLPKGKEGYVDLLYTPVIKLFIQNFHLILEARISTDTCLCVCLCMEIAIFYIVNLFSVQHGSYELFFFFLFEVVISVQQYIHLHSNVSKTRRHLENLWVSWLTVDYGITEIH